jgi:predicted lipase
MTTKQLLDLTIKGDWITSGNDVQYKIDKIDDTLYIAFQWTESKIDWKQNFKFVIKPYRNMKDLWFVHKGFIENYKSVRDEINDKIKYYDFDRIVVLGYSHGAALATLCYEDLYYNNLGWSISAYVFGSPRVVWFPSKKIKYRFNHLFNYQVRGDIVNRLPFNILGYFHVGNIIKVGSFKLFGWVRYHMIKWYYNLLCKEE